MNDLFIESGAVLSDDRKYRYQLWRVWDKDLPQLLWIMLNPSTADETTGDPTVGRCVTYAFDWGYGGIKVCNLFAYRATSAADMKWQSDPIGSDNDKEIIRAAKNAGVAVCGWGNHGDHMGRGDYVLNLLKENNIIPFAVSMTKGGQPGHPLYLHRSLKPKLFLY